MKLGGLSFLHLSCFPQTSLKEVDLRLQLDRPAASIKANYGISHYSLDFGAKFFKEGNFQQCYNLRHYYYGLKNDKQTRYGLLLHFEPTLVKASLGI